MKAKKWLCGLYFLTAASIGWADDYPWLDGDRSERTIASAITAPQGFYRTPANRGSFAHWLRNLPLKPEGSPVLLHSGSRKWNQRVHAAVIDIDTGKQDLQQCADAVMRLWAEYLYSMERYSDIHFNFSSGDNAAFSQWAKGFRPQVSGNNVHWEKRSGESHSYDNFRRYLKTVFIYAGSYSLSKELKKRAIKNIAPGDVFVQGGFPGHAVIVLDVAENDNGEKRFLLAQSYMPAQDIHILKNPLNPKDSPWYTIPEGDRLATPEWVFKATDLKYFPENQRSATE